MSWSGRNLTGASKSGIGIAYTYDKDGLRIGKTVGGVKTTYTYQGSLLMAQQSTGKKLYFSYDSSGKALSVNYNGTEYYYLRNGQGDIVGLLDGTGKKVVSYSYDSWGKLVSTEGTLAGTLGKDNPFRYRGYYYDEETGVYWLLSRYYDPEVGRFINADAISMLGANGDFVSLNLYAYCGNNPVSRKDSNGKFWITAGIMAVGGLIGAIVGAASSAITQQVFTGTINWKSVAVSAGSGFISGAIAASPLGIGWQIGLGMAVGGTNYVADSAVNDKDMTVDEAVFSVVAGGVSGGIGGSGANQHMALTNAVKTAQKTVAKMAGRNCVEYAAKITASTTNWLKNILSISAWESSIKFATGTGVANGITTAWGKVKSFITNLFD